MIVIKIKEFTTFTSVRIFEGGSHPRVRSASSRSHFNRIMREELNHFGSANVQVERVFDEKTDWEEQRDESREQRLFEEGGFDDPSFF